MHPHYVVAFFALLVPLVTAVPGAWNPVNISDPSVIELGKWSVSEYNKNATKKLVFEKLVSGESVFLSGSLYALVLAAKNESLANPAENYLAGVWVQWWQQVKLTAFKYKGHEN
nr:cysteine proteinase inhibitor 5-like [Malus domestica]